MESMFGFKWNCRQSKCFRSSSCICRFLTQHINYDSLVLIHLVIQKLSNVPCCSFTSETVVAADDNDGFDWNRINWPILSPYGVSLALKIYYELCSMVSNHLCELDSVQYSKNPRIKTDNLAGLPDYILIY